MTLTENQISAIIVLFIFKVFLGLKLLKLISWSWWWVTSPIWIPAVLWISALIILFLITKNGQFKK
jgi:hypothetical protein